MMSIDAPTCLECAAICVIGSEGYVCTNCQRIWLSSQLRFPDRTSEKSDEHKTPVFDDYRKICRPSVPVTIPVNVSGYCCARCGKFDVAPNVEGQVIEVGKDGQATARTSYPPNGWKSIDWDVWLCGEDWVHFKTWFGKWCKS